MKVSQSGQHRSEIDRPLGIYLDSADANELREVFVRGRPAGLPPLIGTTMNQKLICRQLTQSEGPAEDTAASLRKCASPLDDPSVSAFAAFSEVALCCADSILRNVPRRHQWEISVPLHSSGTGDLPRAMRFGQDMRNLCRAGLVKVMMSPHEPGSLLVARELERIGIRVNLTCLFSARQALTVLLLVAPSRVSVFLDRIDRGVGLVGLGIDVVRESQRLFRRYCSEFNLATRLIVANVKSTEQVGDLLGCDYLTLPPTVLHGAMRDYAIKSRQLPQMNMCKRSTNGGKRIEDGRRQYLAETLRSVESDFVSFLLEARSRIAGIADSDKLFQMFDDAGYADIFYSPTPEEWRAMGASSLPADHPDLYSRLPPDTLFSLLAAAEFMRGESEAWNVLAECRGLVSDSAVESSQCLHKRQLHGTRRVLLSYQIDSELA